MADGLRHSGNYADGSTFWIAAPGVTPVAMTPGRIAALDQIANAPFCRTMDTFSAFCITADCCGEHDHDGGCGQCGLHRIVREILAEAKP